MAAIEAQHVLHLEYRHAGDRIADGLDHAPMAVVGSGIQIDLGEVTLVRGCVLPPAAHRLVIVGAGVGHGFAAVIVRQEFMVAIAAEPELQDAHAGETAAIAQCNNVRRDQAQVFGDDGQLAERVGDGGEQFLARRGYPASLDGRGTTRRNFPVASKTAEVVDAKDVGLFQRAFHAGRPPGEILRGHPLPAIQGIAPALPQRPHRIGRHAGDHGRLEIFIQVIQIGACPAIGAVVGDENGQVAHHRHVARGGIGAQGRALRVEAPLHERPERHFVGVLQSRRFQGSRLTRSKRRVPFPERLATMRELQRHEQGIVGQPIRLHLPPRFEFGTLRLTGACKKT